MPRPANKYPAGSDAKDHPTRRRLVSLLVSTLLGFGSSQALAQTALLFDGDFESGTFQGWNPGGDNGGFATVAAKGSCYSGNDTTAISFNGNPTSNYAALLRSNADGDKDSIARLRSRTFTAGNGLIFSALSETLDADPGHDPVNLVVNIYGADGAILAELPYRTAIIQLTQGCPSEPRDAAFSRHFLDTHQFAGQEISVEFAQNTNHQSLGYFTLIDNVLFIDQGQFVLSSSQPIAVAGTGLTTSGTFFLDPRASIDPDDSPLALSYSWFINGETSIRELDLPCVNLNNDFSLESGNQVATLYVNDGFNYAADTIRFVIPAETSGQNDGQNDDQNTDQDNDQNSDQSDDQTDGQNTNDDSQDNSDVTLTDPANECDVDLSERIAEDDGDDNNDGDNGGANDSNNPPTIDVGTDTIVDFTIDGAPVEIANAVSIEDADDDDIVSVTVSIQNPEAGDSLTLDEITGLVISGSGSTAITISRDSEDDPAQASEFELAVENILFEYLVPVDADPETGDRTITYVANDGTDSGEEDRSVVTVSN